MLRVRAASQEMQGLASIEDAESFMLKHGESIVDTLGGEVDRIEKNLKVRLFAVTRRPASSRRRSVARTSVFHWRTFPDLCLIRG